MKEAILIALALIGASNAAEACRSPKSERSVFITDPPATLPVGALMLEVRAIEPILHGRRNVNGGVEVKVLDAADKHLIGMNIRVVVGIWTSCSSWGRDDRPVYIIGQFGPDMNNKKSFLAIEYRAKEYRTAEENGDVLVLPDLRL